MTALPFERFWEWLQGHTNCILRAGTPESTLFDDEDYHWHFGPDVEGVDVIQLIRGKRTVGEILLTRADISYVQMEPGEIDEEVRFDLIQESGKDRVVAYFFVLSHGYESEDPKDPSRWTH